MARFAEQVAERALAAGNYSLARRAAERALLVDRFREGAHRLLMLALYAMGRRAEAVRQFRVCRRLLRRELGVTPGPETVRLVQRIVDREPIDRLVAG